ncbi:MAG TPA: Ig-like domain-containing protein [Kofleriaceae bacterium]|nr:Ig-like domain-containing protein [Kofleriaceae bacterium]
MRRLAWLTLVLAGCLDNPSVDVDTQSLDMPRGTSEDVTVSIDGAPVDDLFSVVWTIEDASVVSVTPEWDGKRLRVDAAHEGATVIHVNSHGQTFDIPVHVGPPAIQYMWIEPSTVTTSVGAQVHVKATGLDTMYQLQDLTPVSTWAVRDPAIANLDTAGMMLKAMGEGHTTLHASFGDLATITEVTIAN